MQNHRIEASRRIARCSLAIATALVIASTAAAQQSAPPNIVFMYADDWGFGDLACHGHPYLKTPNIDRLAREGTDFHQFTVCNPVCSPSRTAIVTGQYPARHRIHEAISDHAANAQRGMPDWLDPKVTLLPRLLKNAGYTTGHFGKWHLGGRDGDSQAPLPTDYGYDVSAVWNGVGPDVWTGSSLAKRGGDAHEKSAASFMSAAATEHAIRFLRETKGRPFYMNLWLHETHHLVSATDDDKLAYPDTAEPQRTYYSAVTRADRLIGNVLDTLDELGVADNTIVVFSSDNGPEDSHPNPGDKFYFSVGTTGGLRGRKRSLYLGGVNIPFIVRWPAQVPAGRVDKSSVLSGVDMLPTFLAAANLPLPAAYQPDGMNVLPAFRGESFTRKQPIFWDWRGNHTKVANWPELAIRSGDWALLMTNDSKRIELYDIVHDRGEQSDVAAQQPERVAQMSQQLLAWRDTLPASPTQSSSVAASSKKARKKPAATSDRPTPDRARAFERWDTNHDNVLTLDEYRDGLSDPTNAEARFKRFDVNSDGRLIRAEFVTPHANAEP
ncbi:MAG TPA: sulfatase-like hydrolase/transferase [Pirellulales bacterium]|nr:sulfatase-like hydrolase/transferase [Pirellulales bacterium]